ncbi:MAG: GNAT family N-acetyltransferase [Hyphomicrobiaceae bacterium]
MSDTGPAISLRPATAADRFMLRRWLSDPAAHAQWGNSASAEAEITLAMESPSAICRMVECDGKPIGYGHAVDASLWAGAVPPDLPSGCWDIDLFISAADHRVRDIEQRALAAIAGEVYATTLAVACCTFVSVKNEGLVRAYERAGFRWTKIWTDPILGACWVLLMERPAR